MTRKTVYKTDICPNCKTPCDKGISTGYYKDKEHEEQKAVCQKCGKIY